MPMPEENQTKRTNEQRSAETRSALVNAAIDCIWNFGYQKATVTAITRRANNTSGAIQHHFGSKDELILATLDQLLEELKETFNSAANIEGPLPLKCQKLVKSLWDNFYGRPRYMVTWQIFSGSQSNKELHSKVLAHRTKSIAECEKIWRTVFPTSLGNQNRSMDVLHFMLSFMRGAVHYDEINGSSELVSRQLELLSTSLTNALQKIE